MVPGGGYRRADIISHSYVSIGRHLFIDVAITEAASTTALRATPPSDEAVGVAAFLRAMRKKRKYEPLAHAVSGRFSDAVMERYGACSDGLQGLLRMIAGDADRDLLGADDYYFSAPSRVSYYAQHVVFAGVMGDAAMLDAVLALDTAGRAERAPSERRADFGEDFGVLLSVCPG